MTTFEMPPAEFGQKLMHSIRRLEHLRDTADWPDALMNLAHMAKTAPPLLSALASRDVVDLVLTMSDGSACYGILNARIGWLKDRYLQLNYVGQTFDYRSLAVGDVTTFGAVMVLCPHCHQPGVERHYGNVLQYVHVERIDSWLESSAINLCLWVDESQMTADDAPPSQNE